MRGASVLLLAWLSAVASPAQHCQTIHGRAHETPVDGYLSLCPVRARTFDDCYRLLDGASEAILLPLLGEPTGARAVVGEFTFCHTGLHGPGTAENVVVKRLSHFRVAGSDSNHREGSS